MIEENFYDCMESECKAYMWLKLCPQISKEKDVALDGLNI